MQGFAETPIEFLKGVGPQRGELLRAELGITTFGDLLLHFPFRYVDRSRFQTVAALQGEMDGVQLRGRVSQVRTVGEKQARRLTAKLTDATGSIELVWFKGIRWLQPVLKEGAEFIVFGKVTEFRGKLNMAHPELEAAEQWDHGLDSSLQPVYGTTEKAAAKGLNSRGIQKCPKRSTRLSWRSSAAWPAPTRSATRMRPATSACSAPRATASNSRSFSSSSSAC